MIKRIDSILNQWQASVEISAVTELFTRAIYLFLLLNYLRLIPLWEAIWGSETFVILNKSSEGLDRLAFFLNHEPFRSHYLWFLIGFLFLLLLGVVGKSNFLTRILVFFLFVNIHNANHEISNGGLNLTHQLLFLHMFWFKNREGKESSMAALKNLMHNLSFYGVWLQVCLLYLSAGLFKLAGTHWLTGDAIAHVLSIEEYSLPWIVSIAEQNPWWMKLASWVTLFYQILFAILIWIKPIRSYFLLIGTIIHLGIAFFVGITDFGIIMVLSYLIFMNQSTASVILKRIERRANE